MNKLILVLMLANSCIINSLDWATQKSQQNLKAIFERIIKDSVAYDRCERHYVDGLGLKPKECEDICKIVATNELLSTFKDNSF